MSAAAFVAGPGVSAELLRRLSDEVEGVDRALDAHLASEVPVVAEVGRHTHLAGGKRLRPAFVSLSAKATGKNADPERVCQLGACMEMIHMATLIHDDVIDNASTRRGRPTAAAVFGNTASILAGDTLLAKAMAILARDGNLEIIRNVAAAVVEMAEGEVRELESRDRFDLEEEEHLRVLTMKTAGFIRSCCEVGVLAAEGAEEHRKALSDYGHHIGLAFQIIDDLLDYRGEKAATGKPRATDFREGCATLPLIYLRPLLDPAERDLAQNRFGNGVSDEEIASICRWMDEKGAFARAEARARQHAEEAIRSLSDLPVTPARELLQAVAQFVVHRQA